MTRNASAKIDRSHRTINWLKLSASPAVTNATSSSSVLCMPRATARVALMMPHPSSRVHPAPCLGGLDAGRAEMVCNRAGAGPLEADPDDPVNRRTRRLPEGGADDTRPPAKRIAGGSALDGGGPVWRGPVDAIPPAKQIVGGQGGGQEHPTLTARDGSPPIEGVATVLPNGRRRVRPTIPHLPELRQDPPRFRLAQAVAERGMVLGGGNAGVAGVRRCGIIFRALRRPQARNVQPIHLPTHDRVRCSNCRR